MSHTQTHVFLRPILIWRPCVPFRSMLISLRWRSKPASWRTIYFRLSATVHSLYWQLPSIPGDNLHALMTFNIKFILLSEVLFHWITSCCLLVCGRQSPLCRPSRTPMALVTYPFPLRPQIFVWLISSLTIYNSSSTWWDNPKLRQCYVLPLQWVTLLQNEAFKKGNCWSRQLNDVWKSVTSISAVISSFLPSCLRLVNK